MTKRGMEILKRVLAAHTYQARLGSLVPNLKQVPGWLVLAVAAGGVTVVALGLGVWQLLCGKQMEAANWVMAGGPAWESSYSRPVQLHRGTRQRESRPSGGARGRR